MKIRQGFISNSSSSSFVITEKITTARLAKRMIDIIEADYRDDKKEEGAKWYPLAAEWLDANQSYDGPIVVPWSINYDTFMVRLDKVITIDTCNNHDWYGGLPFLLKDFSTEAWEKWRKPEFQNTLFMDLSTLAVVRKSEYLDLWDRSHKNEN